MVIRWLQTHKKKKKKKKKFPNGDTTQLTMASTLTAVESTRMSHKGVRAGLFGHAVLKFNSHSRTFVQKLIQNWVHFINIFPATKEKKQGKHQQRSSFASKSSHLIARGKHKKVGFSFLLEAKRGATHFAQPRPAVAASFATPAPVPAPQLPLARKREGQTGHGSSGVSKQSEGTDQ